MVERLKQLRTERGISQKALGELMGISQQSINKYENHNVEPDIHTLMALADYFGTSVDYLIGHTDIKPVINHTAKSGLNSNESDLIASYRLLSDKERESIVLIINNYNKNRS